MSPETKACAKCGVVKPRAEFNKKRLEKSGLRPRCRECERKDRRAEYLANPAKAIARQKAYAKAHPEQIAIRAKRTYLRNHESRKARNRAAYARDREKWIVYNRERYAANREILLQKCREYRAAHPERIQARNKAWRLANPERVTHNQNAARARKRNAPGSHTIAEWLARVEEFNSCCAYCRKQTCGLTRDHLTPLSRGGSDYIENIVPACKSCNSSKNAKTLIEFARFAA